MSTWNTDAVDKFLKTVSQARSFNSKEVRLSLAEAEALAMSLAHVLNQERVLSQKLLVIQERIMGQTPGAPNDVSLTGGGF
jgi:hypothetical protein